MKKVFLVLMALIVFVIPVFSQDVFSDVPRDHWAYNAISDLESMGFMIGYPDGTFQGKRSLSRYEFSVAIAKILSYLDSKEINMSGFVKKSELSGYAKEFSANKDVDLTPYVTKDALNQLEALFKEFQSELSALGVDVNLLRSDLNALNARVSELEINSARLQITGEVNFISIASFGDNPDGGVLDQDGRLMNDGLRKAVFMNDIQLDIAGKVNNKITANSTLVIGDYLNKLNSINSDGYGKQEGTAEIIPYYMYISLKDKKRGNIKLGRMPFQINPYVMMRLDDDTYADIDRMENGDFSMEGIDYTFNLSELGFRVWGVRPVYDWGDADLEGNYNIDGNIKTNIGGKVSYAAKDFNISALYSQVASDVTFNLPDKADIYGGQVYVPFKNFFAEGAYYVQNMNRDIDYLTYGIKRSVIWNIKSGYIDDKFEIGAGYRDVDAGYAAPGAWDPDGVMANLTNTKSFYTNISYSFTDKVGAYGMYKKYNPKDRLKIHDGNITDWIFGINWDISEIDSVYTEYEEAKMQDIDNTNASGRLKYFTVGWEREIGASSCLKLMYQYAKTKGSDLVSQNKGSIINAQITVRF